MQYLNFPTYPSTYLMYAKLLMVVQSTLPKDASFTLEDDDLMQALSLVLLASLRIIIGNCTFLHFED